MTTDALRGAGDFFQAALKAFEEKQAFPAVLSSCFSVAGKSVRIRFLEEGLKNRLSRALNHLPEAPGPFDLEITAMSGNSLGVPAPHPQLLQELLARPWAWTFKTEGVITVFDAGSMALTMVDLEKGMALFWCMDIDSLPAWEDGAPFRILLNLWFGASGLSMVHAGAVGTDHGAVLLAGAGGSGKSSAALASCLCREIIYLADDYCLVDVDGMAHSLYSSGKLERKHALRFPHLGEGTRPGTIEMDKDLFFPLERSPWLARRKTLPVRALLVPEPCRGNPSFEALSPGSALRALGPSSMFQMPCDRDLLFRRLAALVRSVPCYTFRTGSRLPEIGPALSAFLKERTDDKDREPRDQRHHPRL